MTREDAINTLAKFKRYISGGGVVDVKANKAIDMAIEALSVDLVRCGECVHWYNDADTGTACEFTNMHEDADGYCSYGERRSDDGID